MSGTTKSMQDKRIIEEIFAEPSPGSFALMKNPIKFDHCRERFAGVFNENVEEFLYSNKNSHSKFVEFMCKTETVLQLEEFSSFHLTNYNTILIVQPSKFWRSCSLRRNLFTVFLRAAMAYNGNYQEALLKENYSKQSLNAIYRFLYGFTTYVGPPLNSSYEHTSTITHGWVKIFGDKNNDYVKKMLVKNEKTSFKWDIENALWI